MVNEEYVQYGQLKEIPKGSIVLAPLNEIRIFGGRTYLPNRVDLLDMDLPLLEGEMGTMGEQLLYEGFPLARTHRQRIPYIALTPNTLVQEAHSAGVTIHTLRNRKEIRNYVQIESFPGITQKYLPLLKPIKRRITELENLLFVEDDEVEDFLGEADNHFMKEGEDEDEWDDYEPQ